MIRLTKRKVWCLWKRREEIPVERLAQERQPLRVDLDARTISGAIRDSVLKDRAKQRR